MWHINVIDIVYGESNFKISLSLVTIQAKARIRFETQRKISVIQK
jgi:hypothetical protein